MLFNTIMLFDVNMLWLLNQIALSAKGIIGFKTVLLNDFSNSKKGWLKK